MQTIEQALQASVVAALAVLHVDAAGTRIEIRPSAKPEFGDLSTPVALSLAKRLDQRPLDLAQRLATALADLLPPHILRTTVTPPGFVNFFINDVAYAADLAGSILAAGDRYGHSRHVTGLKLVIEHTNINSNKAAHVGHVRNACLGDTIARILRALGNAVEVQNYIDDTGVQVADVVVGMQLLGREYDEAEPFDYFASSVYAEIQRRYEADPSLLERRKQALREIEERESATA
ncbi:MAG TPA: arginine--tRNA ligase, partial [Chloroflexota bacterium]|nr:arginine--tRNA ligase [Chloroflexota bacterium]